MANQFEWNTKKAAANLSKHGVSFEEAQSVFSDPFYLDYFDPDHSDKEHRYIIMGQSIGNRLLIVAYTERNDRIRLISARKMTRKERKHYEEEQ